MKKYKKNKVNIDDDIKKARQLLLDLTVAVLLLLKVLKIINIWTWVFVILYEIILITNILDAVDLFVYAVNKETVSKRKFLEKFFYEKPKNYGPIATSLTICLTVLQLGSAVLTFQRTTDMLIVGIIITSAYVIMCIKYVLYLYLAHYYKIESPKEGYILQSYKADNYLEEKRNLFIETMDDKSYKRNLKELINRYCQ